MPFARLAAATTPTCHIGLGLAAVGRPGYINLGRDRDLAGRPQRRGDARAAPTNCSTPPTPQGVRYFDAARSYGRAEEFLADWLRDRAGRRRTWWSAASGATPTPPTGASTPRRTRSRTTASPTYERQRAETGALLGDRLDLYQIHSVTPDSPALTDTDLHARLAEAGRRGRHRRLLHQRPRARPTPSAPRSPSTVDGEPALPYRPGHLQPLEPSAGPGAGRGARRRAHGDRQGGHGQRPARRRPTPRPPLRAVAEETGLGCDAVALALVLRQPWAGVVLSGAATAAQLASNLHAAVVDLDERPAVPPGRAGRGAAGLLGATRAAALALRRSHRQTPRQTVRRVTPRMRHRCLTWVTVVSWLSIVTRCCAAPPPCSPANPPPPWTRSPGPPASAAPPCTATSPGGTRSCGRWRSSASQECEAALDAARARRGHRRGRRAPAGRARSSPPPDCSPSSHREPALRGRRGRTRAGPGIDARVAALFRRGQESGEFRIDLTPAWLTEALYGLSASGAWAVTEGRVAAKDFTHMIVELLLGGARRSVEQ